MGYFLSLFPLSKSATETLLDVSETILIGGGLILTLGAVGEYLEEHGRLPRWLAWPRLVFIIMVVAGLLGEFLSDGGVFVFSRHLQTIADSEIAELTKENTAAKKELEATFMRTRPRMIFGNKELQAALAGKPKADVEILFKPEDEEAYTLGMQIRARLTDVGSGAGWTVSVFRPLRQSDALPDKQLTVLKYH